MRECIHCVVVTVAESLGVGVGGSRHLVFSAVSETFAEQTSIYSILCICGNAHPGPQELPASGSTVSVQCSHAL